MAAISHTLAVYIPFALLAVFLCCKLYAHFLKSPKLIVASQSNPKQDLEASSIVETDSKTSTSSAARSAVASDYTKYGRQYHGYHRGIYPFPCDEIERERLDVYHQVYTKAREEQLFCAPIDTRKEFKVLDVGTGTGIWAIDLGMKYLYHPFPARIDGIDLSLMQPRNVPQNVQFYVPRDFEDPLWGVGVNQNSYDLVHLRGALGAVASWPDLYAKIFRHLKPGTGYIEHVEIDHEPRCDDGSLPDSPIVAWYRYLKDATRRMHRPIEYRQDTYELLRVAGFHDIKEQAVIKVPIGPWEASARQQEIGRWQQLGLAESVEAWSLRAFHEANKWDEKTIKMMVGDVRKALLSRNKMHAYTVLHVWTARRPAE